MFPLLLPGCRLKRLVFTLINQNSVVNEYQTYDVYMPLSLFTCYWLMFFYLSSSGKKYRKSGKSRGEIFLKLGGNPA